MPAPAVRVPQRTHVVLGLGSERGRDLGHFCGERWRRGLNNSSCLPLGPPLILSSLLRGLPLRAPCLHLRHDFQIHGEDALHFLDK